MGLTQISTGGIKDDNVTDAKLPANSVGNSEMKDDAVGVAELSATGTASSSTFLRGDNSWSTPATIAFANDANNRVVTGTGSGLNGEANLTFDGNSLVLENTTGNIKNVRNGGGATLNLQGNQDSGNTVPNDGSDVGNIAFSTADGTDRNNTIAYISVVRDGGTFSNSSHPSKIKLMTCPSGSTTTASRFEVMPDGDVKVVDGDLVIGTSGHGIDFSANSHAGGMTSELLDSYEEGTYTPVVYYDSTNDHTYGEQLGNYTKIGNFVYGTIVLTWDEQNSSGQVGFSLPFTSASASSNRTAGYFIYQDGLGISSGQGSTHLILYGGNNSSAIYAFFVGSTDNSELGTTPTQLTASHTSSANTCRMVFHYRTA